MPGYDVAVVGGGPGGLSAAIFAAERGLKVALFEGGVLGGLMVSLYPEKIVTNYLGFPEGIKSRELANRFLKQAENYGVEIIRERVVEIGKNKLIKTTDGEYNAKAVVIATGTHPRELGIPGESEFAGKGVSYYVSNPEKLRGKRVLIVGGGDSAAEAALALEGIAESVTLVHRRDSLRTHKKNVEALTKSETQLMMNAELSRINGEERVLNAVLVNNLNGMEVVLDVDEVVLAVGLVPNDKIFQRLGLEVDEEGRLITDEKQQTSIEGIYAVGDITSGAGSLELIEVAVAQGAVAAHHIYLEQWHL
jgi:thioredoxin reductase (NADPH)